MSSSELVEVTIITIEKIEISPINMLGILYRGIKLADNEIIVLLSQLHQLLYEEQMTLEELREVNISISNVTAELNKLDDHDCEYTKTQAILSDLRRALNIGRNKRKQINTKYQEHAKTLKIIKEQKKIMLWHYNLFSGIYVDWDDQNVQSIETPSSIPQEEYLEV